VVDFLCNIEVAIEGYQPAGNAGLRGKQVIGRDSCAGSSPVAAILIFDGR